MQPSRPHEAHSDDVFARASATLSLPAGRLPAEGAVTPGQRCVLVVEDEPLVRMFAVDALEALGFAVVETSTGAEAMACVRAGYPVLHAALVDIGLPDCTGDVLVADIRAVRADLPVVVASGQAEDDIAGRFPADAGIRFLSKPYLTDGLARVLAAAGLETADR